MAEINEVDILTKEEIGSWLFSKQLLEECDKQYKIKDEEKLSKNNLNIYKVLQWLELNNKIENHKIKKSIWISVPREYNDFLIVIGKDYFLKEDGKHNREDFEIRFNDTPIFQHNRQPRLNPDVSETLVLDCMTKGLLYDEKKISSAPLAEDFKSEDMGIEEMVEKHPCLEDRFHEVLHFKNVIKKEYAKGNTKNVTEVQEHIDFLLSHIVEEAKIDMLNLMKTCSIGEWQKLAIKLYDKFCTGNSSDLKDDALLNKLFTEHKETQNCINGFTEKFKEYIKNYYYDIGSFNIPKFHEAIYDKKTGVNRPKLGDYPRGISKSDLKKLKELEFLKGPTICFHDTQGFNVNARDIKIKNGVFSCELVFDFYDHFGLDSKDVEKFRYTPVLELDKGFQAWYILQHLSECNTGCKAFVNHATYEKKLELKIE